jgi:hypothetical protein
MNTSQVGKNIEFPCENRVEGFPKVFVGRNGRAEGASWGTAGG